MILKLLKNSSYVIQSKTDKSKSFNFDNDDLAQRAKYFDFKGSKHGSFDHVDLIPLMAEKNVKMDKLDSCILKKKLPEIKKV